MIVQMPYELAFRKQIEIRHSSIYINRCCYGGDFILARLLPEIQNRYESIQANQEDWGWFAWFSKDQINLAIDIYCEDPDSGSYLIHLTSRVKRFLWFDRVADTPELEELRQLVTTTLNRWLGTGVSVKRLDSNYM